MNILILSLSDMHFESLDDVSEFRVEKMIESIKRLKFDKCCIVFCGDITQQGLENEFSIAKKFLFMLINSLKAEFNQLGYIGTYIVPGNHDVLQNSNSGIYTREELFTMSKKGELLSNLGKELIKMNNFYAFAESKKCFVDNKLVSLNKYHCSENKSILFCMINSAVYSEPEDDKGIHYLPENDLARIVADKSSELMITLMHHSPNWYMKDLSNRIERQISKHSSLLFVGHEHDNTEKTTKQNLNDELEIICNGPFLDRYDKNNSEFYTVLINLNERKYSINHHKWNKESQIYFFHEKCLQKSLSTTRKKPNGIFLQELHIDAKVNLNKSFLEYFVFPDIEVKQGEHDASGLIESEKILMRLLDEKKYLIITSDEDGGKTSFLKKM